MVETDGLLGRLPGVGDDADVLDDDAVHLPSPGKRTLTGRLGGPPPVAYSPEQLGFLTMPVHVVQRDGGGAAADDPFAVHVAAQQGVSGGGTGLPYLAEIQRSFGHHDVGGV